MPSRTAQFLNDALTLSLCAMAWQGFVDTFNEQCYPAEEEGVGVYLLRNLCVGLGESTVNMACWYLAGCLGYHNDYGKGRLALKLFGWGAFNGGSWRFYADIGERWLANLLSKEQSLWRYVLGSITLSIGMVGNAKWGKWFLDSQDSEHIPRASLLAMAELAFYAEKPAPLRFIGSPHGSRDAVPGAVATFFGVSVRQALSVVCCADESPDTKQQALNVNPSAVDGGDREGAPAYHLLPEGGGSAQQTSCLARIWRTCFGR